MTSSRIYTNPIMTKIAENPIFSALSNFIVGKRIKRASLKAYRRDWEIVLYDIIFNKEFT
jgi:hypothetical protein